MEQRSAEWFKVRCGRITGSRFARAMSAKHTQSYRRLIDALVDERLTGQLCDGYTSAAMQWGKDYESSARRWYEKAKSRSVSEIGFVVHPEYDYVGVSPDGLIGTDGLIEIKCPQLDGFTRVAGSRSLPATYRWQVQGQLWVCRRQWLDFVCFYPPDQGIIVPVVFDSADADRLAERCKEIDDEVRRRLVVRVTRSGRDAGGNRAPVRDSPQLGGQHCDDNTDSPNSEIFATKFMSNWWFWLGLIAVVLMLRSC